MVPPLRGQAGPGLNDELKLRARRNLVQSKSLMHMLEAALRRYQNKVLTVAEVMEELIKINKEIVASDDEARQMGWPARRSHRSPIRGTIAA